MALVLPGWSCWPVLSCPPARDGCAADAVNGLGAEPLTAADAPARPALRRAALALAAQVAFAEAQPAAAERVNDERQHPQRDDADPGQEVGDHGRSTVVRAGAGVDPV